MTELDRNNAVKLGAVHISDIAVDQAISEWETDADKFKALSRLLRTCGLNIENKITLGYCSFGYVLREDSDGNILTLADFH